MSHSVVRGAIFIPPPTPGGGLSYYILLTRQFGIYLEYDRCVTPNTPHLSLEENKRLYLCYFASFIIYIVSLNYYNYERK